MPFSTLPPLLAEALSARGYAAPTPVQAAVLEPEAEGRDLIVSGGLGCSIAPIRFGVPPEITVVTLRRTEGQA